METPKGAPPGGGGTGLAAELAEFLKVSRQAVNALEAGRYDPSLPLVFKLAALFACTIEDIFKPEEKVKTSSDFSRSAI